MDGKNDVLNDISDIKRYLMLLLSSNNDEPINGKMWYQKELFILSKNDEALFDESGFEPYFWGPYSELAESEMDELVQLGLVENEGSKYVLTHFGKEEAGKLIRSVPRQEKELVDDIKQFLNDFSKDELLLFIYVSYPEMCEDAVELRDVIRKRKEVAIGLYKKGKISIGRAAELAGISISRLIKELQERNLYRVE